MDIEKLVAIHGKVETFVTPAGLHVAIREQNGEDDGILSNLSKINNNTAYNSFLAGIIVGCEEMKSLPGNPDMVKRLLLRDRLVILLQSRIFSLGNELVFKHTWHEELEPVEYTQDLNDFIWDYAKPFPQVGEPGYHKDRIPPYPASVYADIIAGNSPGLVLPLPSGKLVRYTYTDAEADDKMSNTPDEEFSVNTDLLHRNMELDIDGTWVKVSSFKAFSAKDMSWIRSHVKVNDQKYGAIMEVQNPYFGKVNKPDLRKVDYINVQSLPDFFYPLLT